MVNIDEAYVYLPLILYFLYLAIMPIGFYSVITDHLDISDFGQLFFLFTIQVLWFSSS